MTQTLTTLPLSAVLAWQGEVVRGRRTDDEIGATHAVHEVCGMVARMLESPALQAAYADIWGVSWDETLTRLVEMVDHPAANDDARLRRSALQTAVWGSP